MRKITDKAVRAFTTGERFRSGNTRVAVIGQVVYLFLHDNMIARRNVDTGEVECTLANWPTVTTRERLNGICQRVGSGGFYQRDYQQYFADGQAIDDDQWVTVRSAA
jgi:hypothetical protein